jgi:hypothetical protein
MKVVEIYSHLNGHPFMLVRHPRLWQEIINTIRNTHPERLKTRDKTRCVNPDELVRHFQKKLSLANWRERQIDYWVTKGEPLLRRTASTSLSEQKMEILRIGEEPIRKSCSVKFLKRRIGMEIQFGDSSDSAYDISVKHLALYLGNRTDIGIEILPMKALQKKLSSGTVCYESEAGNMIKQGRGAPAVPLVIIGIDV